MEIIELRDYREKIFQEAQNQWSFACFYILASMGCYFIYCLWNSYTFFCCLWATTYLIGYHSAKSSMLKDELRGIETTIEEELNKFNEKEKQP